MLDRFQCIRNHLIIWFYKLGAASLHIEHDVCVCLYRQAMWSCKHFNRLKSLKKKKTLPGSPSVPFFHTSCHNQGEGPGGTLLICNPGYSSQTFTHLPLAFNWKPQCTGVIMAKQVPYVRTGPTQSDTNEHTHTHPRLDEHKLTDARILTHHTPSNI